MIEQSDTIADLAAALAAAQGELEFAVKDSKNPHFKNTYASLTAVLDAIRPVFSKHGLAISQDTVSEGEMVGVATTLMHKSGQWKRGTLLCKPAKAGPQEIGSVITYFRRYGLSAVAGISQDDDDGEAGQGRHTTAHAQPRHEANTPGNGLAAELRAAFQEFAGDSENLGEVYRDACVSVLGAAHPESDSDRKRLLEWVRSPAAKAWLGGGV